MISTSDMKKIFFLLPVVLLAFSVHSATARPPEYTMDISLKAVHMSTSDLSKLLLKIRDFLSANETEFGGKIVLNDLALSDGVRRYQVSDDFSEATLQSAPNTSYEASYRFVARGAPITRISIELHDFRRKISVSGQSQGQVEALARLIYADLGEHETYFGGSTIVFVGSFVLGMIGGLGLTTSFFRPSRVAFVIIIIASFFFLVFGESLLPGVAIYRDSPSLLVRFGPEISFISMLASIVGLGVSFLQSRKRKHRQDVKGRKGLSSES